MDEDRNCVLDVFLTSVVVIFVTRRCGARTCGSRIRKTQVVRTTSASGSDATAIWQSTRRTVTRRNAPYRPPATTALTVRWGISSSSFVSVSADSYCIVVDHRVNRETYLRTL